MSKKTREKTLKKSPKKAAAKPVGARSATSAKIPAAKKRMSAASKSARTAVKATKTPAKTPTKAVKKTVTKSVTETVAKTATKPAKTVTPAATKASHAPPSKPLKPATPAAAPESIVAVQPSPKMTPKPKPETAAAPATGAALAEGAKAPGFRLPRDGGETVALADYAGRKLVLFFYPRADTPGCTKEAIDFTRLAGSFADSQTAVLGVSADPLKAQEAFRDKHELAVPLLSDEAHAMLESYGAWGEKSMYGRTFLGVIRTTVLIGADGRIVRIWRHVKVDGHADEVLSAAQAA